MARWDDLRTRIISAAVLAVVVLALTLAHPYSFDAMVFVMGAILWREWRGLTRTRHWAFAPLGMVYIAAAMIALIYLRHTNLNILLSLLVIVCTADMAAYFTGKLIGKHKIAPTISPGKTWEGLAGSILASAAIAAAMGHMAPVPHAILGAVLAVVGLLGDLFESALKRRIGVKDSGTLLPGHGGLFDRLDALLPCAILAALALYMRLAMG